MTERFYKGITLSLSLVSHVSPSSGNIVGEIALFVIVNSRVPYLIWALANCESFLVFEFGLFVNSDFLLTGVELYSFSSDGDGYVPTLGLERGYSFFSLAVFGLKRLFCSSNL